MSGFVAKGVDSMVSLNKFTHNSLKLLYALQYILAPVSNKPVQGGDPSYITIVTNARTIVYRP